MEKVERLVIALGGNALQSKDSGSTAEAQLSVVRETCEHIAELSVGGYEVAVVHGNGPQVGRILLASETARDVVPAMPFDVCGAMSQGYIGYHIQQALRYALARRNRNIPVVSLVTQMVSGYVYWGVGLIAAVASIAGHYIGSGLAIKNGSKIVRPTVIIVLILLTVKVGSELLFPDFWG